MRDMADARRALRRLFVIPGLVMLVLVGCAAGSTSGAGGSYEDPERRRLDRCCTA